MGKLLNNNNINFPDPNNALPDGLLAFGGDLTPERLIEAYSNGIFPWFSDDSPILWWSPDPRLIIYPSKVYISKSMNKLIKKNTFKVTFNTDFESIIYLCRQTRIKNDKDGTWITEDMLNAYITLNKLGYASSVEVWQEDKLVGGLYGLTLGKCFFGESMFSLVPNASKFAFIMLCQKLEKENFAIIDCQVHSNHLVSLGAELIPRTDFLRIIKENI